MLAFNALERTKRRRTLRASTPIAWRKGRKERDVPEDVNRHVGRAHAAERLVGASPLPKIDADASQAGGIGNQVDEIGSGRQEEEPGRARLEAARLKGGHVEACHIEHE